MADRAWRAAYRAVSRRRVVSYDASAAFEQGLEATERFVGRFQGHLRWKGLDVLDVGCGVGRTAGYIAERGARSVLGVDIDARSIEEARRRASGNVCFETVDPLLELDRRFDLIVSQDSFEHLRDPEAMALRLASLLRPGGRLAIGFGPLWRSPKGAHIDHMTWLPWAHLIFPERVVFDAQERFYQPGRAGGWRTYAEFGLNRMTLARFQGAMAATGLEQEYLAVNAHERRSRRAIGKLQRLPGLHELLAFNVYGIWRRG